MTFLWCSETQFPVPMENTRAHTHTQPKSCELGFIQGFTEDGSLRNTLLISLRICSAKVGASIYMNCFCLGKT